MVVIVMFLLSITLSSKPFSFKRPDLVITKITVDKECMLTVAVKNVGQGSLPTSVYTNHHPKSAGVFLYINGKSWGGKSIWLFDSARKLQKPGGYAVCKFNYKVTGKTSVKAIVDTWNDVKEANEKNNTLRKSLTCKPAIGTIGTIGTVVGNMRYFSISNIRFTPKSPASLNFNKRIEITFDYKSSENVYIFARPMTSGSLTPHYAAHPSKLYSKGSGSGSGFFTITEGKVTVDHVRFQMMDKAKKKVLYEKKVAVKFSFPLSLSTFPGTVVGTVTPGLIKPPDRFMLDFTDAYLVFSNPSKSIQIAAQNSVLSYGSDWEKCQLKPYLYHIRQKFWKGFYWKINTSRKEVYEVTGGTFCQLGGNEKKLNIRVDVVGGGSAGAPDRFFLRFPKAYLVYKTSTKSIQVVAGNKVLSYGQDWNKCNLSSSVFHLKQNVWKGFYWQVNTSKKKVWKNSGPFCKKGSNDKELNISVRVYK